MSSAINNQPASHEQPRAAARCLCAAFGVDTPQQPLFIIACHCTACQGRTGGPFGVGAYFQADAVQRVGAGPTFSRPTDSGDEMQNHFCSTCGTTVFWTLGRHPELVGVAIGTITGLASEQPIHSLFERSMRPWATLDAATLHLPDGYPE